MIKLQYGITKANVQIIKIKAVFPPRPKFFTSIQSNMSWCNVFKDVVNIRSIESSVSEYIFFISAGSRCYCRWWRQHLLVGAVCITMAASLEGQVVGYLGAMVSVVSHFNIFLFTRTVSNF